MNQNGINSTEPATGAAVQTGQETSGFAAARDQIVDKSAEIKDRILDKGAEVKDRLLDKGAEVKDRILDKGAEVKDRLVEGSADLRDRLSEGGADLKDRLAERGTDLKERAGEIKDRLMEQGSELKDRLIEQIPSREQLAEKTDSTINKTGEALHQLADTIREKAPAEGPMGERLTQVANTLDSSGQYLANHGINDIGSDMTGLIRKYPLQSMGAGLALGFLIGATFSTSRR